LRGYDQNKMSDPDPNLGNERAFVLAVTAFGVAANASHVEVALASDGAVEVDVSRSTQLTLGTV